MKLTKNWCGNDWNGSAKADQVVCEPAEFAELGQEYLARGIDEAAARRCSDGPTHEESTQVRCVQSDEVVETFATYRADQPFAISVGGRSSHG